jgi:tRNA(Ile)-lysidine synthase
MGFKRQSENGRRIYELGEKLPSAEIRVSFRQKLRAMNDFTRLLVTEWRRLQLPFKGETFVIAVSGGADSVALALALDELRARKKLENRFVLAHFNHQLRGAESRKDEEFVEQFAEKYGFELVAGKGGIKKNENLEQAARRARYAFLTEAAENLRARGVLTAHTLNDQAETFLINLIRGSGLEGLGAMRSIRPLKEEIPAVKEEKAEKTETEILLIRPLLSWAKRDDTENFCRLKETVYRYDSMNEDPAFRRVRVRKVLLPLLRDFNPKIVETLARTAFLLQRDFEALEKLRDEKTLERAADFGPEVPLKYLTDLRASERMNFFRRWLKTLRGDLRGLDAKHFEAIERLVSSRKSGRLVELPNGENIIKSGGKLLFERREFKR